MEFCGMMREIDRKCLIHSRVHANAHSFDRCKTSGHVHYRKSAIHGLPVTLCMRDLWGREWVQVLFKCNLGNGALHVNSLSLISKAKVRDSLFFFLSS